MSDLNTSHVLIYLYSTGMSLSNGIFKYISCSYLSVGRNKTYQTCNQFKYISCSYLSIEGKLNLKETGQFKYISCSYLSFKKITQRLCHYYLNTSHVLIYPTFLRTSCFL